MHHIDNAASVVARSISQSDTRLRCAKTAKRIEVMFGIETLGDQRRIMLDGGPYAEEAGQREIFFAHLQSIRTSSLGSMQPSTNYFDLLLGIFVYMYFNGLAPLCRVDNSHNSGIYIYI